MTQVVDPSGKVQFTMTYDMTKLAEMSSEMSSSGSSSAFTQSSSSTPNDDCASFLETQTEKPSRVLQNFQCVDKAPHVIHLTGNGQLSRKDFITRKSGSKTLYLYRVDSVVSYLDPDSSLSTDHSMEGDQGDMKDKELLNTILEGTITVTMPGRIISSPVGKITGNTVTFSITDAAGNPNAFIRAEGTSSRNSSSARKASSSSLNLRPRTRR
ncbi:hypothetical protein EXS70_02425 [Candidatus Peribacteria bacterium]|nr:hypothetical protein [Candidatus Peribacteria bacterium]